MLTFNCASKGGGWRCRHSFVIVELSPGCLFDGVVSLFLVYFLPPFSLFLFLFLRFP